MQITFFKRPLNRSFDYKPRYYDEKKEKEKLRKIAMEKSGTGDTTHLKNEISRRWNRIDRKNRNKAKGVNLLVYLLVVALLVYFLFFV